MYTLGIDIGSTTSKCVILEDGRTIVAKSLVKAGTGTSGPDGAYNEVLHSAGLTQDEIAFTMATGYGRKTYPAADAEMSELSCHGKGVFFMEPESNGTISNFVMNDKCSAGTGRFLDVMAGILQLDISELEQYAAKSEHPCSISSTCTVFAESEVISQLSNNVDLSDLVAGICSSVAKRTAALAKRTAITDKVCMSGGVAKNGGVRNALAKELGREVIQVKDAQYMGALGAALAAYDKIKG